MQSIFSFGKKRRSTKRRSTKRRSVKGSKPPSKVLRMCKKYKVKTTVKRGSKRVYKSTRLLVKLCNKRKRSLKKRRSTKRRSTRFGEGCAYDRPQVAGFGKNRRSSKRKGGKRRSVSKAAAMKAFKKFYKSHCRKSMRFGNKMPMQNMQMQGNRMPMQDMSMMQNMPMQGNGMFGRRRRKMRFGAGNPPLNQSMGYEVCPDGQGGLLANGSGLFPQACGAPPAAGPGVMAPAAFGRKRRVGRPRKSGKRKSRAVGRYKNVVSGCSGLKKRKCQTSPGCHYVKRRGCRGRKGTRKGLVYEGPSM